MARHYAVTQIFLVVQAKIGRPMNDKFIELLKRVFIKKEINAFAGRQFPCGLLFFDAGLPPAFFGR